MRTRIPLFFTILFVLGLLASCGGNEKALLETISMKGETFVKVQFNEEKVILMPLKRYKSNEALFQKLAEVFNGRKAMTMKERNELIDLADAVDGVQDEAAYEKLSDMLTYEDVLYIQQLNTYISDALKEIFGAVSSFGTRKDVAAYVSSGLSSEVKTSITRVSRYFPRIRFQVGIEK